MYPPPLFDLDFYCFSYLFLKFILEGFECRQCIIFFLQELHPSFSTVIISKGVKYLDPENNGLDKGLQMSVCMSSNTSLALECVFWGIVHQHCLPTMHHVQTSIALVNLRIPVAKFLALKV
jgi:hypothetical protein